MSDYAALGTLVAGISGCVFGFLGWWRNKYKDDADIEAKATEIKNEAKDVATRAAEVAVTALMTALTNAQHEVAELRLEVEGLPAMRRAMAVLTAKVENCEFEKGRLAERVRDLEAAP